MFKPPGVGQTLVTEPVNQLLAVGDGGLASRSLARRLAPLRVGLPGNRPRAWALHGRTSGSGPDAGNTSIALRTRAVTARACSMPAVFRPASGSSARSVPQDASRVSWSPVLSMVFECIGINEQTERAAGGEK